MQATMHAEMDAINGLMASLPDEEKDTVFHRQAARCSAAMALSLL